MPERPLTVAVTGPTGDIGRGLLRAAERDGRIGRILGMARRPFDPAAMGLTKTEYRRGDVLDRDAVDALVAEADVVVHLAFIIVGGREETRSVNLEGSRTVFAATAAAPGVRRLVYTSSVAAYGFHPENPRPLTELMPARGTDAHYYSAQKAELEAALTEAMDGSAVDAFVLRPSIVAGGDALFMVEAIPSLVRRMPLLPPVLPDPGVEFQLVHQEDVASVLLAAIRGDGPPGVYNVAGPGTLRASDLARALGWMSVPVPRVSVDVAAQAARLPLVPPKAQWVNAVRVPVVMDTTKARRYLGWEPRHDAASTLFETVAAARGCGLL